MVALRVLNETGPRYHAQGMSMASYKYLERMWGQDEP